MSMNEEELQLARKAGQRISDEAGANLTAEEREKFTRLAKIQAAKNRLDVTEHELKMLVFERWHAKKTGETGLRRITPRE